MVNGYAVPARPDAQLDYADLHEYYSADAFGSGAALGAASGTTAGAVLGASNDPGASGALGATAGYSYATRYLYARTPVSGDASVRRFYYIRQDHLMKLVPPGTDPAVLQVYGTFGPHPIGAHVNARIGFNYYFFPVCGNQFASDHVVEIMANEPPPKFRLTCR